MAIIARMLNRSGTNYTIRVVEDSGIERNATISEKIKFLSDETEELRKNKLGSEVSLINEMIRDNDKRVSKLLGVKKFLVMKMNGKSKKEKLAC